MTDKVAEVFEAQRQKDKTTGLTTASIYNCLTCPRWLQSVNIGITVIGCCGRCILDEVGHRGRCEERCVLWTPSLWESSRQTVAFLPHLKHDHNKLGFSPPLESWNTTNKSFLLQRHWSFHQMWNFGVKPTFFFRFWNSFTSSSVITYSSSSSFQPISLNNLQQECHMVQFYLAVNMRKYHGI